MLADALKNLTEAEASIVLSALVRYAADDDVPDDEREVARDLVDRMDAAADPLVDRTEYFKSRDADALLTFAGRWEAEGRPALEAEWREPHGAGWVRWWRFADRGGRVHALFVPAYWRGRTDEEERLLRLLRGHVKGG